MTSAEMLADLKLRLGNTTFGFIEDQLYTHLTKAKERMEDRMPLSFLADVAVKTTAGTSTITLNSTNVNLTSGHTCLRVFDYGVRWDEYDPMTKKSVKWIKQAHEKSSGSGTPICFAVHRISGVLTLELWESPSETIDDFDDAKLKLDITERTTDIDGSGNYEPVHADYAHAMCVMEATHRIFNDAGDARRFIYRNQNYRGELDMEERVVIAIANREASGKGSLPKSLIL